MTEKTRKTYIRAIIIFACLTLVFIVFSAMVGYNYLGKIGRIDENGWIIPPEQVVDDPDEGVGDDTLNPEDIKWESIDTISSNGRLNIILLGRDLGAERTRTDSMMLCSINVKTGSVDIISFLRDTYVEIPGYKPNRLNCPYMYGGFDLLKKTYERNFGVSIDAMFLVNFAGFKNVIEKVGGVDIELSAAEAQWIKVGSEADTYHLGPSKALEYVRIRHLDNDFKRTSRQRNVIMAIYEKVKTLSFDEIMELADTIIPILETNMSNAQVLELTTKLAKIVTKLDVNLYHVPDTGEFTYETIGQKAVVMPDLGAINKRLRGILK